MTRQLAFTPTTIDSLRSGRLSDPKTPGLSVEVTSTGKRTFKFFRRVPGTTRIFKSTLGVFPAYSILEAREWAQGFNAQIDRGQDPTAVAAAVAKSMMTVADAHAIYIDAVRTGSHKGKQRTLAKRSIKDKEKIWSGDIQPFLGSTALADVTADRLWDIVEDKAETAPVRANRLAAELKVFFKYCCSRQGRAIGLGADPATSLSGSYYEEKPRTRFLSGNEIDLLLRALATEGRVYRRGVLLMLLSGVRKLEALEATLDEYDPATGLWLLGRTKNSNDMIVPLAPWGRSIFAVNTTNLFPSPRIDGPMVCGWYDVFDRLEAKMSKLAGKPIERFRPHDLRRTLRSHMARLGVSEETAEAVLNHAKQGLKKVYDRYDRLPEKTAALALWERELIGIATKAGVAQALEIPA